jgi:signal transduction histidine kinase
MTVRCRIDVPAADTLPVALGRTAYRVVQEGLTNARKHASASAVEVAVRGGDKLAVEVVTRRPAGVAVAADSLPGTSSGLTGLDERVTLAGGTLHAGPDADGDFVLRATLPWRR